jgi:hypothetical protein
MSTNRSSLLQSIIYLEYIRIDIYFTGKKLLLQLYVSFTGKFLVVYRIL